MMRIPNGSGMFSEFRECVQDCEFEKPTNINVQHTLQFRHEFLQRELTSEVTGTLHQASIGVKDLLAIAFTDTIHSLSCIFQVLIFRVRAEEELHGFRVGCESSQICIAVLCLLAEYLIRVAGQQLQPYFEGHALRETFICQAASLTQRGTEGKRPVVHR